MHPRDLPEVVADLIIEMHDVQLELRAVNSRLDRPEETVQALPDRIGVAMFKSLQPCLNRLLIHDNPFKSHKNWLNNLEKHQ